MEASKLAALLASHICHELVSPVSSFKLVQDSLNDPDMREYVEDLIRSSSETLEYKLTFLRYALGSVGMQDGYADLHEARSLCQNYMKGFRADLEWNDTPEITNFAQVRLVMNMMMIATSAMPRGGMISVTSEKVGDKVILKVEGKGPRVVLNEERRDSLNGVEPEGGWIAKNIQPYFARECAREIGAIIELATAEEEISLKCSTPE
ncbi:histidine phosphotransferase family protein [Hirschia baltica]|uniref:Histidine phosphotransferase ChpT C-terminal domain-containing protein n=1 Tax=Hirschia baltica (strain ATCC 49814 / DSM 5838 / IFAM 1418) TaxID=582402 RepID=C6XL17_HIRBI|nr:histidine phosphotransferase family protein [Hirschia baltica]ACT57846.1 conserved hypothetical protein [Hirschia baltica ATCC 49814]